MAKLFGIQITRATDQERQKNLSVVPESQDDGAIEIAAGGVYGTYLDLDGSIKSEAELVSKYRDMAQHPELDLAIDDIINEAIITDEENPTIKIVLDDLKVSDGSKKKITEEFDDILRLLEFEQYAYDIFRRWYIDGRLNYHVIVDTDNPKEGIKELRYTDPRKIRKIRETKRKRAGEASVPEISSEYFIYNEKGFDSKRPGVASSTPAGAGTIKIAKDSIVQCTSGILNVGGDTVLSYLHKAIKPLNQLKSMEDSLVIYRISRAPERRIFYIDVGNLPKMKAEQYLRDIMTRFKNKIVYDQSSGEIRDDRKHMSMLEDFWLPRREGGRGTEITTLPAGQNLGSMDDVMYFQKKLNKSLNVPISRLDSENIYNIGRATEITRDEIKFSKFIDRLRLRFSGLFLKLLETQLILKGLSTSTEWEEMRAKIKFEFNRDNYFDELKDNEILRDRLSMLQELDEYAGKYFSHSWIRKNVLHQNDEQIETMNKEIDEESTNTQYNPELNDPFMNPQDPSQQNAQQGQDTRRQRRSNKMIKS